MPIHSPEATSLLTAAVAAMPLIRKEAMLNVLKNEPARVVSAVIAIIGVAASFGLGITEGQQSAIVALVGAVLAVIGGETVRAQVTPVGKVAALLAAVTPSVPAATWKVGPVAPADAIPAAPVADAPVADAPAPAAPVDTPAPTEPPAPPAA